MIFKKFLNSPDKKRLFSNFVSLSILQGANYILPLITFPYLVRVLGVEKFGLLAFATATIAYFQILTDYGFNLSATRDIAIHRENKEKVEEIFSSVMIIKFGLLILSFILLIILVFSFDKFRKDWEVFVLSFGMVVGQVLFPVWFFQGMEKMKYITILNILSKLLFTVAIFVFVKSQADYWKVPLLNSLGFILAGVLALWIVFREFGIRFRKVELNNIKIQIIQNFPLFLSIASIPLFNETNLIILGIFTDNTTVGIYSVASRIIGILITLQVPIVNAIFPWVSNELKKNSKNAIDKLMKIRNIGALLYFFILTLIGVLSKWFIPFIFGNEFIKSIPSLLIMLYVPLLVYIANIYGNQILINLGKNNLFSIGLMFTGLLNLILIIPLVVNFKENGAAISRLLSEVFLTLAMYYFANKELRKKEYDVL